MDCETTIGLQVRESFLVLLSTYRLRTIHRHHRRPMRFKPMENPRKNGVGMSLIILISNKATQKTDPELSPLPTHRTMKQ